MLSPEDVDLAHYHLAVKRAGSRTGQRSAGKAKAQPESHIRKQCLDYVCMLGCFAWVNNTGAYRPDEKRLLRYGKVGSGDILGLTPRGRFLCVETKHGANRQTEAQRDFQRRVEECGGIYILAYSAADIEARKAEIVA